MGRLKSLAFIVLAGLATAGLTAGPGRAATLNFDLGGQLTGASNVLVNDPINLVNYYYDVEFLDGSCVSALGSCGPSTDFGFANGFTAMRDAQALLAQVFTGPYYDTPSNTRGITHAAIGYIFTPYAMSATYPNTYVVGYSTNIGPGAIQPTYATVILSIYDTSPGTTYSSVFNGANSTYASWSMVSVVPLPPSAVLFGTALLGLAGLRRRKG